MKKESQSIVTAAEIHDSKEEPKVLDEVVIEELSIDGVCGVY